MSDKELLKFKDFIKRYRIHFFEKRRFAKFIDSLGMGWHDRVLWLLESWEYYYLRFKDTEYPKRQK